MQIIHAEDLAWSHACIPQSSQPSFACAGFAAHVASEAQVPSERLEALEAWLSFVEIARKKGTNIRW